MVNFETETVVQISPKNLITFIYLQRSEELQLAWREYNKLKMNNKNISAAVTDVRAALISLFKRLKPSLEKSLKPEDYQTIINKVNSEDIADIETAIDYLENYLYYKNITKIDSIKSYNQLRVEEENAAFGL